MSHTGEIVSLSSPFLSPSPKLHSRRSHIEIRLLPQHSKLIKLTRHLGQNISHRARLLEHTILERPDHVADRQRRDAGLGKEVKVSTLISFSRKLTKKTTHLNPTDLMLHEIDQEAIRDLALALLHALQQSRLGRLQARHAGALQTRAQHLQAQADVPQVPHVLRVDGERGAARARGQAVLLGVVAGFGFGLLLLY